MSKPKSKPKLIARMQPFSVSEFTIRKDIPLPPRTKPNPYEGLFSKMKPGDSFFIGDDEIKIKSIMYNAAKYGNQNDTSYAFRFEDGSNPSKGKSCWRVK